MHMHPLRLSLFALIFLAVFSMNNAEADDWEPSLRYVGSYETGSNAYGVAISGDYAYVVDVDEGLIILNIEDPTNPTLAGSYGGSGFLDITLSGNYAYVATNEGLVILNITDPSNPEFVGDYDVSGGAYGVAISGNYAYVASEYEGLVILDIEDPSNPEFVGNYYNDVGTHTVTISGNHAFVGEIEHGLVIVDIEDPANPTYVGRYFIWQPLNLAISGDYAYVVDDDTNILFMINIQDPANLTLSNVYTSASGCNDLAILGDYVYGVFHDFVILAIEYTPLAVIDSISPSPARSGNEISFSGSGEDYDGIIVAYEWTSSLDGFLSNEKDFSTTGFSVGNHSISFRVQDNGGGWSDYENETLVVYPNSLPIALIDSISPSPAEKGTTVFFNGTSSDSDGTIVAYLWESSIDGQLSTDEDFSTSDLSLGQHTITFRVQDNDGALNTVNQELWIYAFPVAIAGQDSTGTPGVPLQFSGAGTDEDGTIVKYEWDFDGDGVFEWSSTENGRELNIYNNEDTYTATLRVTDNDGFTDTDTVEVTISEKKVQIDDGGNVTVTDAGEDEEGIPSIGIIVAAVSIGLIARFRRR